MFACYAPFLGSANAVTIKIAHIFLCVKLHSFIHCKVCAAMLWVSVGYSAHQLPVAGVVMHPAGKFVVPHVRRLPGLLLVGVAGVDDNITL